MLHLVSVLAVHVAGAACPADSAILWADTRIAALAWNAGAWVEFEDALVAVREDLGCLSEVIPENQAAPIHHLFAMAGVRHKDEDQVMAACQALLVLDEDFDPGPSLAPPGSLLRWAWEDAFVAGAGALRSVPDGAWFVDGKPVPNELPVERAALVQLQDAGNGYLTWYLDGGEVPPDLEERLAPPAPPPVVNPAPRLGPLAYVRQSCAPPSRALLLSGVALGVVGFGGMAVGEALENNMMRTDVEREAEAFYRRGLVSSFGGLTLTLTGAGLATGSVVHACHQGGNGP